ncbi:MAG: response regulator [Alkalinema sp. RU_4_3]|nr:response regulator [Alkalinema sp. RU_4_3]
MPSLSPLSPLSQLTHDLRTPLNAILGLSEALLEDLCGELNDRQRKAIQTIECAGNSLLEQIDHLQNLPFTAWPEPSPIMPLLESSMPPFEPNLHRPTILIADDNAVNSGMLMDYFSEEGFNVLTANDGAIAIEMIHQHQPDLVLMDVMMPTVDGLTAIGRIRANPQAPQPPIIALTALAMSGDSDRCLQAGATAYFSKPIKLKPLLNLVQSLLLPNRVP